jgi:2-polyprenyl-3-methyl-5-hydroxy-6-metoxy-1,4-benzoquinol methylase
MIDKKIYAKLREMWKGRIYSNPCVFTGNNNRMEAFRKYKKWIRGMDVLEVGCNAGMFALEMSDVVKSYVGIEREKWYYKQALETQKLISNKDYRFICCTLADIPNDLSFNAFVGLYVTYHFSNDDMRAFETRVLPKCNVVFLQVRTNKRKRIKNRYGLESPRRIARFLIANGMNVVKYKTQPITGKYVTIIAERNNRDTKEPV